jgi:Nucleolin binding domain
VDVGVMAKELQDKYSEYTRRKTVPFRILVEQGNCMSRPQYGQYQSPLFCFSAYKLVLRSYGLDSNPSSDNEEGSDADVELMEVS